MQPVRSHLGRNEHLPLQRMPPHLHQPQRIRPPPTRRHMPNPSTRRPRTHRPRLPLLRTPTKRHTTPHQLGKRQPRTHRMTSPAERSAALPRAEGHRPTHTQKSEPMPATKRSARSPRTREVNVHRAHRARERGTPQCPTATEKTAPKPRTTSRYRTTATTAGSAKTNKDDHAPACVAGRTSPTPPKSTASADRSAHMCAGDRSAHACADARGAPK